MSFARRSEGARRPPSACGLFLALRGATPGLAHQDIFRAGLQRSGIVRSESASATGRGLVPLPNDTVSDEYWKQVNAAITLAQAQAVSQASNGAPVAASPWEKIYSASASYEVSDSDPNQPAHVQHVGVVPYDMAIGAHVMHDLSALQGSEAPAPSQADVTQAFVAQCPSLSLSGAPISITAPGCAGPDGAWTSANQSLAHWRGHSGGVAFFTNTATATQSEVKFATIKEQVTVSNYIFSLSNCLGVPAYVVEESVMRFNNVDEHANSQDGDTNPHWGKAVYYQYDIRYPNGTGLAQSQMYRTTDNAINFTLLGAEGVSTGFVAASASRVGSWSENGWSDCEGGMKGWSVGYPDVMNGMSQATVQDLRVATAAVVTLMAFRAEEVALDGFEHQGQGQMYWALLRNVVLMAILIFGFGFASLVWQQRGWGLITKRFFFKLETVILPQRACAERLPVLHATY